MDPSKHPGLPLKPPTPLPAKPPTPLDANPVAPSTPIPSVPAQRQQPFGGQSNNQFSPPSTGHGATGHGAAGHAATGAASVLWFGGIPPGTPKEHLEFILRKYRFVQIDLKPARNPGNNWFAFIHFADRRDAENARLALDGKQIFPSGAPCRVRYSLRSGPQAGQPAIAPYTINNPTPAQGQLASTPFHGVRTPQLPHAQHPQTSPVQHAAAPFHGAPMPHQPQAQHTQPYPSSNPQAYPNQAGYVPYDASFQQQRPTTPAMSPSRPKSAFQQVGPHGYGPQQSPMSAVSRNPYPPSLPFRPAPSVSSTSSYQHARPAGSVPYQAQSSDQGSMSAYTAPSAFTVNQSPVTGPKGASPVEHHGQGGGNAAKNAQHTSHAVAGPHQGDQPGPALDRPSAPKPTEAPSALAAPDNGQSDKRVEESGQERKKVKLNKKQRARARRAREDAANQMTAAQTATQAGTQEASQSTATETSVTAEASIDTASIPKVGVEDNHHPSVEPGGTQSQAAQQEPSGDNNEDKDAAVVDQTMHDASSTETDIHKGVTDDTTATAAPDKAATTGAEEVSNIDKGKAAATMVEEDTTTSFGGPSSGAVQPSASRPKVPFQLTKPQQPRTSLAHQAHQEVTAPAPASHTAGINSTSLEEDQVPGAAASSPTEELGGDKPKQDVGSSEVTDTVGSNPSAAPFSHQSTSYLASDPTPMEGTKATKAGQGNGQQNVALPEPVINTTRKKARKRAARRAQPTQTASAANDREQSIDSGATSPENATTENAADGATTENPGDNNPASATEDAAAPGAQLDTVELQFPKLPRLVVDQAATPGPSQFAPGRTCDCDLTPEGFGHHCKAGYNWDDFTAEMAREADAASPLNWPDPVENFPRRG